MKMVDSLLNYPEFAMYVFVQMSEEEIENFFRDNNPMKLPPKEMYTNNMPTKLIPMVVENNGWSWYIK